MPGGSGNILKPGDQTVQPFLPKSQLDASAAKSLSPISAEPRIADALEAKLILYEAEIAQHKKALAESFAKGEVAGRIAAEADFEHDRTEALAALEKGLESATEALASALAGFEALALEAAHAALEMLVGDSPGYRELLTAAIVRQTKMLKEGTVLSVTVSRMDFPDSRETDALALSIGGALSSIQVAQELEAGQCIIQQKLGTVEFDFGHSWQLILATLLGREAGEGDAECRPIRS